MKKSRFAAHAMALALGMHLQSSSAAEACVSTVEGVQMVVESTGTLALYVFSREVMTLSGNGSTYLYYSGSNEAAKAFQAQFLSAKATGNKLCVGYTPGTPSHRWVLVSVGVADADGWPWQ